MLKKQWAYRPDIDGLRALSILAVIIYHYFQSMAPGGYAGVDIFFVISGYLITSIIIKSLDNNNFSILNFYIRRILRIAPALLLFLFSTYIIGYLLLTAENFQSLNKSIFSSLAFSQNLNLYFSVGNYFQRDSLFKPLIHLWSLGVEEQFYLLFPLIIALLQKWKFSILKFFSIIGLFSIIFNIYYAYFNPSGSYYLPQSRFWEITAGICLAYLERYHKPRIDEFIRKFLGKYGFDILSVIAVALLGLSFFYIHKDIIWYGLWAAPAVLASVLAIWAGPRAAISRIFLCSRPFVAIGKISYPLYLYHWTLFSLVRIISAEYPSRKLRLLLILFSLILSWLTYILVEKKVNNRKNTGRKMLILSVLSLTLLTISFISYQNRGLPARSLLNYLPESIRPDRVFWQLAGSTLPEAEYSCIQNANNHGRAAINYCEFGSGQYKVLVTGDSHAIPLYHLFEALSKDPELDVHFYLSFVRHGNPLGKSRALAEANTTAPDKWPMFSPYFAKLYQDASRLGMDEAFFTASWGYFGDQSNYPTADAIQTDILNNTSGLRKRGIKLSILLDVPHPQSVKVQLPLRSHDDYLGLFRNIGSGKVQIADIYAKVSDYRARLLEFSQVFYQLDSDYPAQFLIIDPTASYCAAPGRCPAIDEENLRSYYYDSGHQTRYGAMRLYNQLKQHFIKNNS